jgi:hypothetical protein
MTKIISPELVYVAAVVGVAYATGSFSVLILLCLLLLRTPAGVGGEGEQQ